MINGGTVINILSPAINGKSEYDSLSISLLKLYSVCKIDLDVPVLPLDWTTIEGLSFSNDTGPISIFLEPVL